MRHHLERALADADFVEDHLGEHNRTPRPLLYADSEFGFCIFAHVYTDAKGGEPHDHAGTWAIYGQASGTTELTEWPTLRAPDGQPPGLVHTVHPDRPSFVTGKSVQGMCGFGWTR